MDQFRPFLTQLQLAKCQCKAAEMTTLPLEKLSFLRGGFLIIERLCGAWLAQELFEHKHDLYYPQSITKLSAQIDDNVRENLPANVLQLQQSDWFDDFLKVMSQLEDLNASLVIDESGPADIIAMSQSSLRPSLKTLKAFISNFEHYFESIIKLSEEY
ncbi:hypothetical protein [uncultured Pseudoteredinibacter sp.]|uniref:hypothetical protein n=1 Tax=uncultured Pseudoteredinibacter sp. TaxID=1641701 RepID=UPI002621F83D|nr:hypothetical protein [uncultured Pseudoteredinibacter sp.]